MQQSTKNEWHRRRRDGMGRENDRGHRGSAIWLFWGQLSWAGGGNLGKIDQFINFFFLGQFPKWNKILRPVHRSPHRGSATGRVLPKSQKSCRWTRKMAPPWLCSILCWGCVISVGLAFSRRIQYKNVSSRLECALKREQNWLRYVGTLKLFYLFIYDLGEIMSFALV